MCRALYFALAAVLLGAPASLYAWTEPLNISNTPGLSHHGCVTADSTGRVHVVWADDFKSDSCRVLHSYCQGDSWSTPSRVAGASPYSLTWDILTDCRQRIHAAWYDGLGEICWSYHDGASWAESLNVSNRPGPDFCPRMAPDNQGRVHMVWHDYSDSGDVWYSVYNGSSWSVPHNVSEDAPPSAYPDIAVDPDGRLHLVWMDYGDQDLHYSVHDGSFWSTPVNVSRLQGWSCDPRLAIDSHGRPHVVWEERRGGGYHIYYTSSDGSCWFPPCEISDGDGFGPTVEVDAHDNVHVLWGGGGSEMFYRFYDGSSWSEAVDIAGSSTNCTIPDMYIGKNDWIQAVWTKSLVPKERSDIYYSKDSITCIEHHETLSPRTFDLIQNFPNPFSTSTVIRYSLNACGEVTLSIYDLKGTPIRCLADRFHRAGYYEVRWDGNDGEGAEVATGIYLYRLTVCPALRPEAQGRGKQRRGAGDYTATKKMVVVR